MDFVCGMRYIAYKHHQLVIGHARHTTLRFRPFSSFENAEAEKGEDNNTLVAGSGTVEGAGPGSVGLGVHGSGHRVPYSFPIFES